MTKTAPQVLKDFITYLVMDSPEIKDWPEDRIDDLRSQIQNELRPGQNQTNIQPLSSGYYESDSVVTFIDYPEFTGWIGWTYYYGGGKHSNPDGIEWIEDAYFLSFEEREVTITQKFWTKINTLPPKFIIKCS